ncbi:MAG TPA: NAD(P)-dependent oxidoreductase [Acidimicrobiia bacterium]|jgi:3-hydroxyisobutyrate dehydrogenase-like beta-hydroxyacid dehydrogenase
MERIGVVGLGIMGMAYARNLLAAGHEVSGFDVDPARLETLGEIGGSPADSNAAVARASDVLLVALPRVSALHDAVEGPDGLLEGVGKDLIVVEMSTFPLAAKDQARHALATVEAIMIDAPVSGTGIQAEAAEIVVYASGDRGAIERVRPVFDVIAKASYDLGEFGNGSKMKFVANLLVSVHNLATAEAFVLGTKGGLDPARILEVISAGVGSSRIFEIRGPMIVADDYPPAARLSMFIKDIAVIGEFARSIGVPTPLLDATLPWYQEAVEQGLGEMDAAALARLLKAKTRPGG